MSREEEEEVFEDELVRLRCTVLLRCLPGGRRLGKECLGKKREALLG